MRELNPRERRIVRFGLGFAMIYLAAFGGLRAYRFLESRRLAVGEKRLELARLDHEILREAAKARRLEKLRSRLGVEVAVAPEELVPRAREAIQRLAAEKGVALASAREVGANASSGERSKIQLGGVGPVPGVLGFVDALTSMGVPALVDGLSFESRGMEAGSVRFALDVVILDRSLWSARGRSSS